jgi:uncharacterized LabA/DUF88 family protein
MWLHRTYYYDAQPLTQSVDRPLNGGRVDFGQSELAIRSRQLFQDLAKEPFTALRIGELSFEGWRVSPRRLEKAVGDAVQIHAADLEPQIAQMGVDMRIGMDIAALTLKRQAQVIVLVTGDSDFIPAMKFARREGAQLYLVTLGHGVKAGMLEHSDLVLELPAPEPPAVAFTAPIGQKAS